MTNKEVFISYSSEQWVLEENLCFMLQDLHMENKRSDQNDRP
jgi:hypothetical protein